MHHEVAAGADPDELELRGVALVELDQVHVREGLALGIALKIMPDLDLPRSTVSRALGPVTVLLSILVARLAGGHRAATHSLAFALLLPAVVWAGMHTPARPLLALLVAAVCVGLTLRALGPRQVRTGGLIDLGLLGWTVALTWWGASVVTDLAWLPAAVGVGVALHLFGDLATPQGIPLLWPNPIRCAIPLLADGSGGLIETLLARGLFVAVAALALTHVGAGA